MYKDHSKRYLTVRILYPKSGDTDKILTEVKKVSEAARKFEGLIEIGAWIDQENDRIVNISLWESKDLALKATSEMHPLFSEVPWDEWERQPADNILGLVRAV